MSFADTVAIAASADLKVQIYVSVGLLALGLVSTKSHKASGGFSRSSWRPFPVSGWKSPSKGPTYEAPLASHEARGITYAANVSRMTARAAG